MGAFVAAMAVWCGAGVQLLGDLVLHREDGHRRRCREAEPFDHLGDTGVEREPGLVGGADFVVAQLERNRDVGPACVGQLHLEGLHHVLGWHVRGIGGLAVHESSGEAVPSFGEPGREFRGVALDGVLSGACGVEVGGEPAGSVADAELDRGTALDHSGGEHLGDDSVRERSACAQLVDVERAADVAEALFERGPMDRRCLIGGVGHAESRSSWRSWRSSVAVTSPSRRASSTAVRRRSDMTVPRQARIAWATVVEGISS